MGLRDWICRRRSVHTDRTRDVIAEAEATRRDLVKLTARLDLYTTDLRDLVHTEMQRDISTRGLTSRG